MYIIQIRDKAPEGYLDVELVDLIALTTKHVSTKTWFISHFDAVLKTAARRSSQSLFETLSAAGREVEVAHQAFESLSRDILQVIDGVFRFETVTDSEISTVEIAILDSTVVEILTNVAPLIVSIRELYSNVTVQRRE